MPSSQVSLWSRLKSALQTVGAGNVARAARYARLKKGLDARWATAVAAREGTTRGVMVGATSTARGARFQFSQGELEVTFLAPDLVRVTWLPGILSVPYAIAKDESQWDPVASSFEEQGETCALVTSAMRVEVGREGWITFRTAGGTVVREDLPPRWQGDACVHTARLQEGEAIYGLGGRAAPWNRRGTVLRLWNRDPGGAYGPGDDPLYVNIPTYLGIHASGTYLVFFENSYAATFDLGKSQPGLAEHYFAGGALRYYVAIGSPATVISRYTELTGRPDLPPLWSLGYHQSRWSYYPEERVRRLAADFDRYDIPCDAIHLDIDYMDGYRVFTWDRERFPHLPALAADLLARGIHLVTIIDPGVKVDPGYHVYQEGLAAGAFCKLPDRAAAQAPVWPGWCVFPDFTDARTRSWWGEQYRGLVEAGVSGFWNDMNEPATFVSEGDPTLPLATQHSMEGRGGDHCEGHNLYGLLMARATAEGVARLAPERRPFVLTRSGWAGMQRYAWNWTGDSVSNWDSLRLVTPMVMGLGLSGVALTGPDVGGFSGAPTPELFIRWLQLGTFMPFFRTHTSAGTPDQEPWSYGEPYLGIAREFIRLRYALLPYTYTAAWQASAYGWPMVRPLFWPDGPCTPGAATPCAAQTDDAFFFGDALLVAPVLEPEATARSVTMPAGAWYDFWDGTLYNGPGEVTLIAPLARLPVLVRAGTVLPMTAPARNTAAQSQDQLTLHVYPPIADGESTSVLYTDAGDGFGYRQGQFCLSQFRLARSGNHIWLGWERTDYPPPYRQVTLAWHGREPVHVRADGRELLAGPPQAWQTGLFEWVEIECDER